MRRLALLCALMLICGLVPAAAHAANVTLRIEAKNGPLFERATVAQPTTAVAPASAAAGQSCAGESVIGAVQAAVPGRWSGVWSDTTGWSLKTIAGVTADVTAAPRQARWVTFINGELDNSPPCQRTLTGGDNVLIYPACVPGATNFGTCFTQGPLELLGPNSGVGGPGAPVKFQVRETAVSLNPQGEGTGQTQNSAGAQLTGPEGSATTDDKYGTGEGALWFTTRGPAVISATKDDFVPDRVGICITDGADGFCGTTKQAQTPFDPYAFCPSTGNDGYCGSPDQVAPLGRISTPAADAKFAKGAGPLKLTGTVDFDPSLTDHVDLRLMRQVTEKVVIRYKKKRVIQKKRVRGKLVRKKVTKRIAIKANRPVCYGWSDTAADWKKLKKCDASTATLFRAEGAEIWSYSFLNKLPNGKYTLDAVAQDGAGNVDKAIELGRNRVSFTVS